MCGSFITFGSCVRDVVGKVVVVSIKLVEGWGDAEVEEARALIFESLLTWESGYRNIIAESDCFPLISKIYKERET